MKKFRFSLKSVSTVRALREVQAREQYSRSVHALVAAEEMLQTLRARLVAVEEMITQGRQHTFRSADQTTFIEALRLEETQVFQAEATVAKARHEMELTRQNWLITRRDLRLIEKLETSAREKHRLASDREEQAAMDDRSSATSARTAHAA